MAAPNVEKLPCSASKPGELTYGNSGRSTPHHLFMEMIPAEIEKWAQVVKPAGITPE